MTTRYYLEPVSFASGAVARSLVTSGEALALGRGDLAATAVRVLCRANVDVVDRGTVCCSRLAEWQSEAGAELELALRWFRHERGPFAGIGADRPAIMGVLNVTPDSFSDGGDFFDAARAIDHGVGMVASGADIIDVGGESTRPGAGAVSEEEELRRVIPVVRALADQGAVVSIDTRSARVMREAIDQGARIVNDVSALSGDPQSMAAVAAGGASVILMHMRGVPATMQDAPQYDHVLADVYDFLERRVETCVTAGIDRSHIAVDPGIGFGKTAEHNLRLIDGLGAFRSLGCAVVLGVSRKGFIGRMGGALEPKDRLGGSLALALAGIARGADIVRVHDVRETRQALSMWHSVTGVTCADDQPS